MSVNQTEAMLQLSYLLGESTVPSSGVEDRKAFIQRTVEEIYRAYPWNFAQTVATVAISSGSAALPSGIMADSPLDVREVNSSAEDDFVYQEISYESHDDYGQGDYKFWIDESGSTINTKEDDPTLTIRYQAQAPTLAASVATPFNDSMTIALGALRFVRMGENPEADITQEESNFQLHLDQHIAMANRSKPRPRRRTAQSVTGAHTGEI